MSPDYFCYLSSGALVACWSEQGRTYPTGALQMSRFLLSAPFLQNGIMQWFFFFLIIRLFLLLCQYKHYGDENLYIHFPGHLNENVSRLGTQIHAQPFQTLPSCFPECLYQFTPPKAMQNSSFLSTSLPELSIMNFTKMRRVKWHLMVVSLCISLITVEDESVLWNSY